MNEPPHEINRRILIIDDNRAIHGDFRKILCPDPTAVAALEATARALFADAARVAPKLCYELDSAYQGQDGLLSVKKALAEGRPFAMAFVDVRMPPGWDGIETTQRILAVDPDIQIVICTAYADYSWKELFETVGNRHGLLILKKPFDTVEVLQLAHSLTEKRALLQQSRQKMEELESAVAQRTRELLQANQSLQSEIAEHTRAEQELRWKTAFLEAKVNSSMDGILVVDQDGKPALQNQRFLDLCKVPEHIASEQSEATRLRWAADKMKNPEQFSQKILYLNSHPNETSHDEIEMKDGTVLERYSFPAIGKDGKYYGRVWTFRDISERKRAEAARVRLAAILESTTDLVGISDPGGHILYINRAGRILLGVGLEQDIAPFVVSDFLPNPAADPVMTEGIPAAIRQGSWRGESILLNRAGRGIPVSQVILAHRTPDGTLEFLSTIIRDISERKRFEAQLFQSQKMDTVGKLAGGIAHEFNSILTAILGQAEIILSDLPAESRLAKPAIEIHHAAERAAKLTRQLLAFGRKQILQPRSLDLNLVLADMEGTLKHLMGRSVDVRIVPAAGLKLVQMDPGQMEQVIVNITMNAAAVMPNGGKLTLETANVTLDQQYVSHFQGLKPGEYVMLAISDTGPGIKPEAKQKIFEPFFTTKGVGEGPGLGLATCYGILKQSGGHINAYSETSRGATFKVYLPQVEATLPIHPPRPDLDRLPCGTETILLVEDDPALREMASTLLTRLGYTVFKAADGVEALNLRHQPGMGHVDLVFTDVVMPHMDGKELSERFKIIYPKTRILFTSAYTENAIAHQGVLDPGTSLLQKPFTPSALARKLREVLDQPAG